MEQIKIYWEQAMLIVQKEVDMMSQVAFKTFIEPVKPYSIEGNNLTLLSPDTFMRDMIMKKYYSLIKNSLFAVSGIEYNITII